jgi:hypothetical protein
MIKFSKVSPWFMWFVGYIHGFTYWVYFKPNGFIWQWFVFLCVTYMLCYLAWRKWYERYEQAG